MFTVTLGTWTQQIAQSPIKCILWQICFLSTKFKKQQTSLLGMQSLCSRPSVFLSRQKNETVITSYSVKGRQSSWFVCTKTWSGLQCIWNVFQSQMQPTALPPLFLLQILLNKKQKTTTKQQETNNKNNHELQACHKETKEGVRKRKGPKSQYSKVNFIWLSHSLRINVNNKSAKNRPCGIRKTKLLTCEMTVHNQCLEKQPLILYFLSRVLHRIYGRKL